jgi:hypothetical protein
MIESLPAAFGVLALGNIFCLLMLWRISRGRAMMIHWIAERFAWQQRRIQKLEDRMMALSVAQRRRKC